MANEIETKVLDINKVDIVKKLFNLGGQKIKEVRFVVDWYRPKGITEGSDPWFLRIRSDNGGTHEVTWKAKSKIEDGIREHAEINFPISEPEKLSALFESIGLEKYAHQEKDRTSFSLDNCIFEIDEYPGMPAFLEIEGNDRESIGRAIESLGLANNKTWAEGERTLIQQVYNLDWYSMKF